MYDMIKNIYADILSEYLLEIKQQSADVAPIVINRAKFDTRALIIAKTYVQNKIGRTASAEETVATPGFSSISRLLTTPSSTSAE